MKTKSELRARTGDTITITGSELLRRQSKWAVVNRIPTVHAPRLERRGISLATFLLAYAAEVAIRFPNGFVPSI